MDAGYSQELNYQFILLSHLDRISKALTFPEIEKLDNNGDSMKFAGEGKTDAVIWAVEFFRAILPDSLQDEDYRQAIKDAFKKAEEDAKAHDFKRYMPSWYPLHKLHAIVNLLDRRGLLLSKEMQGFRKPRPEEEEG